MYYITAMHTVTRTNSNQRYVYASERDGDRVLTRYVGSADDPRVAKMLAEDAERKAARAFRLAEQNKSLDRDREVNRAMAELRNSARAVLLASGFRRTSSRTWRRAS